MDVFQPLEQQKYEKKIKGTPIPKLTIGQKMRQKIHQKIHQKLCQNIRQKIIKKIHQK